MKALNKIKFDLFYFFQAPTLIFSILIPLLIVNISTGNEEKIIFLLLQVLFLIIFYILKRSHLISFLKDLRWLRLGHYFLWGFLGASITQKNIQVPDFEMGTFWNLILASISLVFAILFSIVTNNYYDREIDSVSNPNRPLIVGAINEKDYQIYGYIFLFLSLISAALVNSTILGLISLFILAYFVYSVPPLRIKRIPVLSKWIIGLNSIVLLNIGSNLFYSGPALSPLPSILLILGIGLASNFIDLKDIEGDSAGNITTLPTILGAKNSKRLIGVFFLTLYPTSTFFLISFLPKDFILFNLLPFMLLIGFLQMILINRKNYNEIPVFLLNNFSVFAIAICILKFHYS